MKVRTHNPYLDKIINLILSSPQKDVTDYSLVTDSKEILLIHFCDEGLWHKQLGFTIIGDTWHCREQVDND